MINSQRLNYNFFIAKTKDTYFCEVVSKTIILSED